MVFCVLLYRFCTVFMSARHFSLLHNLWTAVDGLRCPSLLRIIPTNIYEYFVRTAACCSHLALTCRQGVMELLSDKPHGARLAIVKYLHTW